MPLLPASAPAALIECRTAYPVAIILSPPQDHQLTIEVLSWMHLKVQNIGGHMCPKYFMMETLRECSIQ